MHIVHIVNLIRLKTVHTSLQKTFFILDLNIKGIGIAFIPAFTANAIDDFGFPLKRYRG